MPTYDECLVEAELRARADYATPGRHYHDEGHLDDCLSLLDAVHNLAKSDRRLLRWAILWHDSIYDPARSDNEELSAERASRELVECGINCADAHEVARLIRLTKDHSVGGNDRLGALLVSIDLSILGDDPDRYRAYLSAVRAEYAHLSDEAWRSGRTAVLEHLLEREPLYPDPGFRARLERQARRNLEAELKGLTEG